MNNQNLEKRVKFTSENQPANRGRKKNVFKKYKEKYDLSSDDVNAIIEYLMSKPTSELIKMVETNSKRDSEEKEPAVVVSFASAILNSIKWGNLTAIEMMLNRKIGKPKEVVEHRGSVNLTQFDLSKLSDEDLEQLEKIQMKMAAGNEPDTPSS